MNILTEIIEKSDDIITILKENQFFQKNPFCPILRLKYELQIRMQRKWEVESDMNLTPSEFEDTVTEITREELSEVLYDLVDRGVLQLSVNSTGNLVYNLTEYGIQFLNKELYIRLIK